MNQMPNRSARRAYLKRAGALKKKSKMPIKDWLEVVKNTIEEGKKIHDSNMELSEKAIHAWYEKKETEIRESLREAGKTEEEIKAHLEGWYETIK
jgi:hypothetical protein